MKNNDIKFETLRKPIRKKIIIGSIALVAIVSAITITTSRAKYRLTQSIPVVRGKIYYYNGDLNVMAVKTSEDGTNYNDTDTIPTSGYTLNTTKSICKVPSNDTYIEDKSIPMEYKDGRVYIGVVKKKTKCYLYFDRITSVNASTTLLSYAKSKSNGVKTSFSTPATTNEGIYEAVDPMYGSLKTSYYWRGAVTDNHVIFANYCWQIIRINGDDTIRMIYNGAASDNNTTCTGVRNGSNVQISWSENGTVKNITTYNNEATASYYVGWTQNGTQRSLSGTNSTIKGIVENWYTENIANNGYDNKVVSGKFCNDREIASGYIWEASPSSSFNYAAKKRLEDNYAPTLSCNSGDTYNIKVGLITADEAMYAGGVINGAGVPSYYLSSSGFFWTMTPGDWLGGGYKSTSVFAISSGSMYYYSVRSTANGGGVRPVINLSTSATFKAGATGESTSPYIVES